MKKLKLKIDDIWQHYETASAYKIPCLVNDLQGERDGHWYFPVCHQFRRLTGGARRHRHGYRRLTGEWAVLHLTDIFSSVICRGLQDPQPSSQNLESNAHASTHMVHIFNTQLKDLSYIRNINQICFIVGRDKTWWLDDSRPPALLHLTDAGEVPGTMQLRSRVSPSITEAIEGWMVTPEGMISPDHHDRTILLLYPKNTGLKWMDLPHLFWRRPQYELLRNQQCWFQHRDMCLHQTTWCWVRGECRCQCAPCGPEEDWNLWIFEVHF